MFIYKITHKENNLSYIGLDTHPAYKEKRWKEHIRDCTKKDTKFYLELRKDISKFEYEVIYYAKGIEDLVLAEIRFIKEYNTYKNGYNSSPGGDAFNYKGLKCISQEAYNKIIDVRRKWTQELNLKKWEDTTPEERKFLCKHLHTESVINSRKETLKKFYQENPEQRIKKGQIIKQWQEKNRDSLRKTNRENGKKGSEKVSKKVKIEYQDGTIRIFNSISEFKRLHGDIMRTVINKTNIGIWHKGIKGWIL